jgi:hypothetical protein
MQTDYKELYLIFGVMAFIIISATVGLILFVKYLNRDSRERKHTDRRK